MSAEIFITGVTGNVGSEVVKGLKGRIPFRIGAHDVARAQKMFGKNHDIVHFDFLDPATFDSAFVGIKKLFLVRPPALSNVKRDIAPALYAAVEAGVTHIVFLSLQGVESNRITPHYKIETLIRELNVTYTFLRAGFFMQNLSTIHRAEIQQQHEIVVPVGQAKTSFIDVRDIASVAVCALTEIGHDNKVYTLTGQAALDYDQIAAILSHELKQPIRYTNPSAIGFLWRQIHHGQALSPALVMTVLYTITRWGNASAVTMDVAAVLKRSPIAFEQFAHDYRASWMT